LAKAAGFKWQLGSPVTPAELDRLTDWLADTLLAAITQPRKDFYLTEPLANLHGIAGVMFSGGVAEYVYGREERDFCDLGLRLGRALRRRLDEGRLPWRLLPAGEGNRATVLGASPFRVELSVNMGFVLLPCEPLTL